MFISTALKLEDRAFIALVGAGGKSSILQILAEELLKKQKRVILTTTTKMFTDQIKPFLKKGEIIESASAPTMSEGIKDCFKKEKSRIAILIGRRLVENGREKFSGPEPYYLNYWWQEELADFIIIEADGAKGRPIKAPSYYEPVKPTMTTDVVGVIGIEAVGLTLDEKNVFRSSLFSHLTGLGLSEVISLDNVISLINHTAGLFKNTPYNAQRHLFLNKVNSKESENIAKKLAYRVLKDNRAKICDIIIGNTLQKSDPVSQVISGEVT